MLFDFNGIINFDCMKKLFYTCVMLAIFASTMSATYGQVTQTDLDLRAAFKRSYEAEIAYKYTKAIEELAPFATGNTYEVALRLGYLNVMAAKFLQAANYYQKCVDIAPKSVEARLGLINALAGLEKWDEVIRQYKEILKVDSGNAKALYNLGLIYFNRLDYANAQLYLTTYVSLYPFDFDGVNLAGWTAYYLGKKEEAYSYFKKALLLNPSSKMYDKVLNVK
jgi:tetratricopeptide (TPR) repeat protein